jgi:hypothetical protein
VQGIAASDIAFAALVDQYEWFGTGLKPEPIQLYPAASPARPEYRDPPRRLRRIPTARLASRFR